MSSLRKTGDPGYDAMQIETEFRVHEMCRLFSNMLVENERRELALLTNRFNLLWEGGRTVAVWAEVRRTQVKLAERDPIPRLTAAEFAEFARSMNAREGDDHG